ncbi:LuxR C-terminal-related transcriptional regulator [Kitasatospora sp. NPDC090091]|uniref:LuxR C-terminal-related transcriptional regulator n=1 Tax=Kitasatospora sp. NPDC090091 TaxID=3364081 RepID=UPI00382EF741
MSTPPTAERPTGAPAPTDAPAPQGRPGKGRPGRGRAAAKPAKGTPSAPEAQAVPAGQAAGSARGRAAGGGSVDPAEASRLLRQLTPREAQALAHLAAGRPLAESAAVLGVTPATARTYQHRAMRKLGTRTRAEIGAFAALLSPAQASPAAGETAGAAGRPDPAPPERGAAKPPAGPDRSRSGGSGAGGSEAGGALVGVPDRSAPDRSAPGGAAAPAAPGGRHRRKDPADGARPGAPDGAPPDTAERPGGGRHRRKDPAGQTPPAHRQADRPAERQHSAAPAAPAGPGTPVPAAAPTLTFEELYETVHARLVQQTFLLTACKHRALHCVGRAFAEAQRHWIEVSGEPDPEGRLRTRAFEAALSPWHRGGPRRTHVWRLPHRRIKVRPADETQAVLPDHDRLTDHDRALLKALKRLSRPQRRALVLHDGLGLPADAVAVEVESTVTAAEGRVWAARAALAHWVPELVGPDPAADGFADRLSGLLHRAAVRGCPEPHRPPAPLLRARHGLADAGRTGAAALLTAAVGAAVVATLSGGGPGQLFRPGEPPAPTLCATAETTAAVPALPEAPPTGVHSLWCSPTPGVEPVVVDPPPPRRLWELPSAGHTAEALPPPGAVVEGPPACTGWTLHPCPTDDA